MTKLVTYDSGTQRVSLPGHLWDTIWNALERNLAAWGDEEESVKAEHAELIDELENLGFYLAAHADPPADLPETPLPQVLVHLDGGLVQDIIADRDIRAVVLDYDTDGADIADLYDIPQGGGGFAEAFRSDWGTIKGTESDGAFIVAALAADYADPEAAAKGLRQQAKHPACNDAVRASLIAEAEEIEAKLASEFELTEEANAAA